MLNCGINMSEWYERPERPSELDKLDVFIGEWVSVDKHHPMEWMKEGEKGSTKEIFKRALDGYCFLTDIEAETPFGNIKGHGFTFFDKLINKFRFEWFDNFGNHISGVGSFTDDQTYEVVAKYTMNGVEVIEKHTDRLANENEKVHIIGTLTNNGYELSSELYYKKVKKS